MRKKLQLIHLWKYVSIKVEVEKLLHVGFIYLVPLMELVSNIFPINMKQGTIRMCVDYQDLNMACPK